MVSVLKNKVEMLEKRSVDLITPELKKILETRLNDMELGTYPIPTEFPKLVKAVSFPELFVIEIMTSESPSSS